jgi:hypothetical protein
MGLVEVPQNFGTRPEEKGGGERDGVKNKALIEKRSKRGRITLTISA